MDSVVPAVRPSGTPPYWLPGTVIAWRYRRRVPGYDGPESLYPVTVADDGPAHLAAWLAPSTPILTGVLPDGRDLRSVGPVEAFRAERAVRRRRWRGPGILMIAPTAMPWSVWCFWDAAWQFRGWYVNLEDPHERDALGVLTQDHILDLWVNADRVVRWKDEGELAAAVIAGRYSAADANRFRENAKRVERLVADWQLPFAARWEDWRPDPSWRIPSLPEGMEYDYDSLDEAES